MIKEIIPRSRVEARVRIPGSKSLTHRAFIAAALARGRSRITNFLDCEDTHFTAQGLQTLGVQMEREGETMVISGTGGLFPSSSGIKTIFLGNSGTSCRLLLSVAALARGDYLLTGSPRLQNRPVGELVQALNKLGAGTLLPAPNGCPPVTLKARGLKGGKVEISGRQSSQFISSLLLAAPYAVQDVEIEVLGEMVSEPYIELTLGVMDRFGVSVVREGSRYFKVTAGKGYQACPLAIEGDISNASYFWAAAAVTEGSVTITDLKPADTRQGDLAILEVLEAMGCRVERGPDWVTVQGAPLQGIDLDMKSIPDQVPTVAALAMLAKGRTVIRNVPHLRLKESDRIAAVANEWNRLGGRVDELPDGLVIQGGLKLTGVEVDPHDDHRLAMSLAVIGLRVPGIRIREAECANKSFPLFWDYWDRL
jgi:3-phosphoshikimate 1-carboxyvinyltransferase